MRTRPRFRPDDEASGQVIALMTAGAIFLAAVASVLVVTIDAASDAKTHGQAANSVEAAGLADILVGSSGVGWTSDPDTLQRLGLMADNGSGIDPARLDALRGGMALSADNGKVDYDDALESFGLDADAGAGFHIRVYPVGIDDLEISPDLSVGYIGDWLSLPVNVKVALPVTSTEGMTVKANAQVNATMIGATLYERQALRALGVDFTDRTYIALSQPNIQVDNPSPVPDVDLFPLLSITLMEGDVYPDIKSYLEAVLPGRLAQYDVLVVGSGVDHGNLVKDSIKTGIKDWVLAGGTLIVLGSADQSTAWLNPLLNVGVDTVNGAPTAPDIAHPLLKEPNELAWTSYDSHDQGWDIQDSGAVGSYEDFSHVVIQDGEDVLAVSKAASFGTGRVILTTYQARDIAGAISLAEATDFLENLVSYADRSALYLDYGGTVPADQPVSLAVRQSWLWDEVYGEVPVRIEVLAWS